MCTEYVLQLSDPAFRSKSLILRMREHNMVIKTFLIPSKALRGCVVLLFLWNCVVWLMQELCQSWVSRFLYDMSYITLYSNHHLQHQLAERVPRAACLCGNTEFIQQWSLDHCSLFALFPTLTSLERDRKQRLLETSVDWEHGTSVLEDAISVNILVWWQ